MPSLTGVFRRGLGALVLAAATHAMAAGGASTYAPPDAAAAQAASEFAAQVMRSGDAGGRAFGVIDKQAATLWLFDKQGQAVANTPVLVGQAKGDTAPADIGTRPLSRVKLHEKVTTAGRYLTEPGKNHKGEDIVWLDYDNALSMHRVRNVPKEFRTKRLLTPAVDDNRISFGCVNVPASFYDRYIDLMFSRTAGVVYVLPETKPVASVFPFAGEPPPQTVAQRGTAD